MSIAYNFPDISISPIREADEDELFNISCSTDGVRTAAFRNPNETLPVEIVSSRSIHFETSRSESESGRNASAQQSGDPLNINVISPGALIASKMLLKHRTHNDISQRESSVEFDLSGNSLSPTQQSVVPTGDAHNIHDPDNYVPDSKSIDLSSEEAFQDLEKSMGRSLFASNSSADIGANSSNPMTLIMRGTRVFVDLKCCPDSESAVRCKLREMGAVVERSLAVEVTHVVFSRGGCKKTLENVLSRESGNRPYLLDPHWVHDSYSNGTRLDELGYSLYGCQYLVDSLRRQSNHVESHTLPNQSNYNQNEVVELTPEDDLDRIDDVHENTNISHTAIFPNRSKSTISLSEESMDCNLNIPMTATQLLGKIEVLSKRLDRCADDQEPHNRDCPSRIQARDYNYINAATNTCQVDSTPKSSIRRRRTHGAFALEYRAPGSLAVFARDVDRETYNAENGIRDITNRMKNLATAAGAASQCPVVNNMQKTTETNLNNIRNTLRHNAHIDHRNSGRRGRGAQKVTLPRNLQLSRPFYGTSQALSESDEEENATPTATIRRPIVKTTSDLINRLQCVPSSDEFRSCNEIRDRQKKKNGRKAPKQQLEIVLTGFPHLEKQQISDELELYDLGLSVQTILSENTRCLVSATGDRTIQVLKAVVRSIPVVSLEWVAACCDDDRLVPMHAFEYHKWSTVIEARTINSSLFRRLGKILVDTDCSPAAKDMCFLIRMSHGAMTTDLKKCMMVIAPEHKEITLPLARKNSPVPIVVNEKYILDCIEQNEVLLVDGYSR